ncbi:MAG: DEAD/DEAH box helicase [Cyanobium sp.]
MLPSVVASELEQVATEAIRTAFHPTTPGFAGLIDRFLADRDQLFKGPSVSVALPFHQGSGRDWFPLIPLPFPPYRHQERAFERLSPGTPVNTLVATGTGSGKTECFLRPLLDHCRQEQDQFWAPLILPPDVAALNLSSAAMSYYKPPDGSEWLAIGGHGLHPAEPSRRCICFSSLHRSRLGSEHHTTAADAIVGKVGTPRHDARD